MAKEPAERDGPDHAGERVGRDGQADEEPDPTGRRHLDGEPGDRDDAHPVAQR
jgi:hypothetical protein